MGILIVDDSKSVRYIIKSLLGERGYKDVKEACSAKQALEILRVGQGESLVEEEQEFELILMDIIMEDMDGVRACEMIKKDSRYQDTPIIMITSETKSQWLEKAFNAGATDYIQKQTGRIELYARVESALKLNREIKARKKRERELEKLTRYLERVNKELEEKNNKLERMVNVDGLTGIANRRIFDEILQREWNKSIKDCRVMSLIIGDIDYFKNYNDTYGHLAGDECLIRVAKKLKEMVTRPQDLVARYGGEEFGIILPYVNLEDALLIAERVRSGVKAMNIPHSSSPVSDFVTMSLGVTTINNDANECLKDHNLDQYLNMSDRALYKAKEKGRDRVEYIISA